MSHALDCLHRLYILCFELFRYVLVLLIYICLEANAVNMPNYCDSEVMQSKSRTRDTIRYDTMRCDANITICYATLKTHTDSLTSEKEKREILAVSA